MVCERDVEALDGRTVPLLVDTICVHGDTPGAVHLAASLRAAFTAAGVEVKAVGQP